jgi:hypothetical protein
MTKETRDLSLPEEEDDFEFREAVDWKLRSSRPVPEARRGLFIDFEAAMDSLAKPAYRWRSMRRKEGGRRRGGGGETCSYKEFLEFFPRNAAVVICFDQIKDPSDALAGK